MPACQHASTPAKTLVLDAARIPLVSGNTSGRVSVKVNHDLSSGVQHQLALDRPVGAKLIKYSAKQSCNLSLVKANHARLLLDRISRCSERTDAARSLEVPLLATSWDFLGYG